MKAKEMFEKLGYECIENNEYYITYQEKTSKDVQYTISIVKWDKKIEIIPKINGKDHFFVRLDMELLKAINKQLKELGWK